MNEITTILTCLHPLLDRSTYRQLLVISQSLLVMTGRVTMLGMSRWAEPGGSYRTVQRFFAKDICWPSLNWSIIKSSFGDSSGVILIAGDATTVTKSGKKTFAVTLLVWANFSLQFTLAQFQESLFSAYRC